jgi:hypothetical protein
MCIAIVFPSRGYDLVSILIGERSAQESLHPIQRFLETLLLNVRKIHSVWGAFLLVSKRFQGAMFFRTLPKLAQEWGNGGSADGGNFFKQELWIET